MNICLFFNVFTNFVLFSTGKGNTNVSEGPIPSVSTKADDLAHYIQQNIASHCNIFVVEVWLRPNEILVRFMGAYFKFLPS